MPSFTIQHPCTSIRTAVCSLVDLVSAAPRVAGSVPLPDPVRRTKSASIRTLTIFMRDTASVWA